MSGIAKVEAYMKHWTEAHKNPDTHVRRFGVEQT